MYFQKNGTKLQNYFDICKFCRTFAQNFHKMKRILTLLVLAFTLLGCSKLQVSSPDDSIRVEFRLNDSGSPQFRVTQDNTTVIHWSALGFIAEEADLINDFHLDGFEKSVYNDEWETVWGEERMIKDHHKEMIVHLSKEPGIKMDIVFRCFNDGFAFRYVFPKQEQTDLTVTDEMTEYRFTDDHDAWSIPWRTEYYEGLWTKAPLSQKSDTLCSPLTLELTNGGYAFVHEAALTDYPAQNFYMADGALKIYLTPWLNHPSPVTGNPSPVTGNPSHKACIKMPFSSPWRMVILTRTLPEMVASRIMLNLNEPCAIDDTSWIRPMKFIGIWWGMHMKSMTWEAGPKHGATTANMERYMRFAKDHHIDAVLAEGWNLGWETWEHFDFTTPYPDWDMDYLAALAQELGVEIIGHNETGGNAADYERDLDTIYRYHAKHGIHAIKTGYVSPIIRTRDGLQWNKGQSGVRHYRKVIETAAKYHIAIDNHEPVMPTGLQRTYPNLMTQEGVRGQEWNAWSQDGGSPCNHVTILPFTRVMAGPVDYTPGVFAFENPVMPQTRVHSTLMNQLGLMVCIYSPLQMACDLPENYLKHPEAFAFIERVPCDWERSLLVDGKIGEFCIFARQERGAENWYIGGITNEERRDAVVPLSFLPEGKIFRAHLWRDAAFADWQTNPYAFVQEELAVTHTDTLFIPMASGGGFAAEIIPVTHNP